MGLNTETIGRVEAKNDHAGPNLGSAAVRRDEPTLAREDCSYQYCFCEENVLQLLKDPRIPHAKRFAVGITGDDKYFAIGATAGRDGGITNWDYHVIMVAFDDAAKEFLVYDLDSALPFPTPLARYVDKSFSSIDCPVSRKARFRIFPADTYLTEFSSDRSHMRDETGAWRLQPPSWPAITNPDGRITIAALNDAKSFGVPGTLARSPEALLEFFSIKEGVDTGNVSGDPLHYPVGSDCDTLAIY